jgi:outer membrane cobalamin receptor
MRHSAGWLPPVCRLPLLFVIFFSARTPLAAAATLAGLVTDPDDRVVVGANVVVATPAAGSIAQVITDARGEFRVGSLPAGRYDVRVLVNAFQADPLVVELGPDERRDVRIHLRLSAVTESVVVSAAQVDLPSSRAVDSITVVTAADLQAQQVETASDALRMVPGLSVARSGGRGAITSLFPRGGSSNYTLVLVDGIRANAFTDGGFDFAHLPVSGIERIEVVRGPQSALFGSDAIGAVVQVVTRRGGPPRVEGSFEGGSYGTERLSGAASGSRGAWTWGVGGEQDRSNGYTGLAPASDERVSNDDDHLVHGYGSVGWQRPNGLDVVVNANVQRDERGFPGPFGSNPIGIFPGVDEISRGVNDTQQIGSSAAFWWSSKVRQRVEASYTRLTSDFTSPYGPSSSGTRRLEGRVQEDLALSPAFGASAGVELLGERGTSTFVTGMAGLPVAIERSTVGTFGEVRYTPDERLSASVGVRFEHIRRDGLEGSSDPFSPRPAFSAQVVRAATPKVAVGYLLARSEDSATSTRLRVSAGTGIRPPNVLEIAFTDNPSLRAERSRSFSIGLDQQFAGGAYVLAADAFFNRYEDLIVTVGTVLGEASRYRTDNISSARARGLEISAAARPFAPISLRAAYTFLDSETLSVTGMDIAVPPFAVGDPLIRRPRHQLALSLSYAVGRVSAFGQLSGRSRTLDIEPNYGALAGLFFAPGYSVVNAGTAFRVGHGVEVYVRGSNLLNRNYEEVLGYPALGRNAIAGVRVAAGR